jgi:chromatin segregation and condensation protein Rec8/ScpA/Scc1 (kleisin family)
MEDSYLKASVSLEREKQAQALNARAEHLGQPVSLADLRMHELDYFERRKERESESRNRALLENRRVREIAEQYSKNLQKTRMHQIIESEQQLKREEALR